MKIGISFFHLRDVANYFAVVMQRLPYILKSIINRGLGSFLKSLGGNHMDPAFGASTCMGCYNRPIHRSVLSHNDISTGVTRKICPGFFFPGLPFIRCKKSQKHNSHKSNPYD
ncbi:hypothetical protein ES703_103994 [subsurface metagenome]